MPGVRFPEDEPCVLLSGGMTSAGRPARLGVDQSSVSPCIDGTTFCTIDIYFIDESGGGTAATDHVAVF